MLFYFSFYSICLYSIIRVHCSLNTHTHKNLQELRFFTIVHIEFNLAMFLLLFWFWATHLCLKTQYWHNVCQCSIMNQESIINVDHWLKNVICQDRQFLIDIEIYFAIKQREVDRCQYLKEQILTRYSTDMSVLSSWCLYSRLIEMLELTGGFSGALKHYHRFPGLY